MSFRTLGCRLNQAETARLAARFESHGYDVIPFGQPADVCVIHTCTVTANAEKTCTRGARSVKRSAPSTFVVLAGCAVEIDPDRIRRESGADLVVGQTGKFRLPELIAEALNCPQTSLDPRPSTLVPRFETTRALLPAQDGCDFCCSYCIVPAARGKPVSRPFPEVLDEARRLVDAGYRELVLTGANIACYHHGNRTLVELLEAVEAIDELDRLRLSSIEITGIARRIIDFMAQSRKLCRTLHLPLQSGDDTLLQAMGRRYSAAQYAAVIEYAAARIPHLGLGTDIITGFPGEDDAAFRATVSLVETLPFSNLHVFPYSPRPGTAAAGLGDPVPRAVKKQRSDTLIRLGNMKRETFAASFVGCPVSVLVERCDESAAHGWTSEYLEARITGRGPGPNQLVEFTPSSANGTVLVGPGPTP